jgi:cell division protein ZapA (FtsZ GTPase activity inhibitor)
LTLMRLRLDVLGQSYPIDCDVDDAGDIQRLALIIDRRAREFGDSPMALTDADLLLRVALQLVAENEALGREPDFAARLDRLSHRVEALNRQLEALQAGGD